MTPSIISSSEAAFTMLMGGEQLETLKLARFYREWCRAAQDGGPPTVAFLDSHPCEYLAGTRLIFDVEQDDERRRYRYRHIDRQILAYSPRDMTGLYIDQHAESYFAENTTRAFELVVETRRPIHARVSRLVDSQSYLMEFLILPLVADDRVAVLFGAQLFSPVSDGSAG